MKRRRLRFLFNVFAFSLLALSIYLNVFRMKDKDVLPGSNSPAVIKKAVKGTNSVSKVTAKRNLVAEP